MPKGSGALPPTFAWWSLLVLLAGFTPTALAQRQPADCSACHPTQAEQFNASVHYAAFRCPNCHGGKDVYELTPAEAHAFGLGAASAPADSTRPATFDHGESFHGKAARKDVPVVCGSCHADVERMNPYGL